MEIFEDLLEEFMDAFHDLLDWWPVGMIAAFVAAIVDNDVVATICALIVAVVPVVFMIVRMVKAVIEIFDLDI